MISIPLEKRYQLGLVAQLGGVVFDGGALLVPLGESRGQLDNRPRGAGIHQVRISVDQMPDLPERRVGVRHGPLGQFRISHVANGHVQKIQIPAKHIDKQFIVRHKRVLHGLGGSIIAG